MSQNLNQFEARIDFNYSETFYSYFFTVFKKMFMLHVQVSFYETSDDS